MDDVVGLSSPNARTAQIRKFCANPPPRAHTLRLETCEDPSQALGEWSAAQCQNNGNVCLMVDSLLQEHCNTLGRGVEALLGWYPEQEGAKRLTSKTLRARPEARPANELEAVQSEQLGIDGTPRGHNLQMQRHHEVLLKSYLVAHQSQINTANQLVERSQERYCDLQERYDKLQSEHRALVDELCALARTTPEAVADEVFQGEGSGPETDKAKAEAIRTMHRAMEQALPMLFGAIVKYAREKTPAA